MLAFIIAGLVGVSATLGAVVSTPTPAADSSPNPSPSPTQATVSGIAPIPEGTPIREVTFSVNSRLRIDDITETFGGGVDASPPASAASAVRRGTVSVDVMGKSKEGVLFVVVREQWQQRLRPERIKASISPTGEVSLEHGVFDDIAIELLPFFATRFLPDDLTAAKAEWQIVVDGTPLHYSVVAMDGSVMTIHKTASIQGLHSETIDDTVTYNAAHLAPTGGTIFRRGLEMYEDGQTQATLYVTFDQLSDTPARH